MNNNINYELELLFARWQERMEKKDCFTKDGILYKNDLSEDEAIIKWTEASKRVLFLLKDQHQFGKQKWIEDIRYWLKDVDWDNKNWNAQACANRNLKSKFFKNIAYILWGLIKADKNNDWLYQEVENHHNEVKEFLANQPFALVECKKDPGGPICRNPILRQHIKTYGDLLKEEIAVLNPNMIVCTNGIIYDFILKMYSEDELVSIEGKKSIRFHPNSGTLIFCSYHPSCRKSPNEIYEGVMDHYRAFLKSVHNP